MKNLLRFLAFIWMVEGAYAQSNLPACQGRDESLWTNCFGTQVVKNGVYVGEYKNGNYNGQGAFTFSDGSKYAGEFRNGKLNGQVFQPDSMVRLAYRVNGVMVF